MKTVKGVGLAQVDLGFSGIERWPRESDTVRAKGFEYKLGAGPQVTLVQLMKLGCRTGFATWLGNDIYSRYCKEQFDKIGLEYIDIAIDREKPMLKINSVMKTSWNSTIVEYDCSTEKLRFNQPALYEYLGDSDFVIMDMGLNHDMYRRLKVGGKVLLLDAGWSEKLSFNTFREYIQIAHYFFPNRKEAEKLTGMQEPKDQARILSTYYRQGVIKLGKEGVFAYDNGQVFRVPPLRDFRYVEQSGSGDSFMTGFIYGLAENYNFKDCVLAGSITRAKLMSHKPCIEAPCSKEELDGLIIKYKDMILRD